MKPISTLPKWSEYNSTISKVPETTKELQASIEIENKTRGFDELEKNFEKNEATKKFLDLVWSYVEFKLDKNFSDSEKSNIKLIILWEIQKEMQLNSIMWSIVKNLLNPMKDLINNFNSDKELWNKSEDITKSIGKIATEFSNIFKELWLESKIKIIDSKIEKINKEKRENKKEFKCLTDVFYTINWVSDAYMTEKQLFDNIKLETEKWSKLLNSWVEVWDALVKWIEKLPFNLGDDVKWFLRWLANSFPLLWMIFKLIFWEEFLSVENSKNKKATKNLLGFYKQEKSPLKETKIKEKEIEELKPKKLKSFYELLRLKEIDYTWDNFWEEFLVLWKTKNSKIIELQDLLKNEDWSILRKDESLESFLNRLNWIEEVKNKKGKEKSAKAKAEAEAKIKVKVDAETKLRVAEEIKIEAEAEAKTKTKLALEAEKRAKTEAKLAKTEAEKEEAAKKIEAARLKAVEAKKFRMLVDEAEAARLKAVEVVEVATLKAKKAAELAEASKTFEEYLIEWKIKIWDKLENISINEQNHILKIWNNSYKISIEVVIIWNVLEKISFNNGIIKIIADWEHESFKWLEVKNLLKELISRWWVEKDIEWKPAKLIIKKV